MGYFSLFTNPQIDIEQLHQDFNSGKITPSSKKYFYTRLDRWLYRWGYWEKLVDSGLKREWCEHFLEYWLRVLGGRKNSFPDFFYLLNLYRGWYSDMSVENEKDANKFINSWQDPRNLFLLLHYVYKLAKTPFSWEEWDWLFKLNQGGNVLEYGAGMAPIITSLIENRQSNFKFYAADIKGHPFHYAKYRLHQFGVKFYDIDPLIFPKLEEEYDIVFILTVLEHLPDPMEVVESLTSRIKSGKYLVFDYIKGNVEGLDTKAGQEQREKVLRFIEENFTIVRGQVNYDTTTWTTVAQKK